MNNTCSCPLNKKYPSIRGTLRTRFIFSASSKYKISTATMTGTNKEADMMESTMKNLT